MNRPDRLPSRRRRDSGRGRHAMRPLVESLEQRLQLSLVAATPAVTLTSAPDNQNYPVVATDAAGDYVVAWANYTDAIADTSTIEAQVFNASGTAATGIITVNSSPTPQLTTRSVPSVAMDANGDFVVAWELEPPQQPSTGYYYDIEARRFTLSGAAVGGEFQVAGQTAYPNELIDPTVAMNSNSFVIGWQEGGTLNTSPVSIDAQRYSFSGATTTPVGSNFAVTTAGRSLYPSVAMDTAGDFVFTWNDGYNGTNYSLLGQIFNASGAAQGSAIALATSTSPTNVPVAMNGGGRFAIAYYTGPNTNPVVHAHQYALTGTESSLSYTSLSGDVAVFAEGNSTYQGFPSVGIDAQGFATIAFANFANATSTTAGDVIDALRLNPDGTVIEASPIQVAAQNTTQALLYPRVAISPAGKEAFAWEVVNKNAAAGQTDQIAERLYNYANDAPTINTIANQQVAESGSTTVPLSGITGGGNEEQTLMVTASSTNTSLIVPTVTYTSPNSTGTLNLVPIAGQSGTATITVTVTDGGGTANGGVNSKSVQFTITVIPPPTANPQTDAVAHDSSGTPITLAGSDPNLTSPTFTYAEGTPPTHGSITSFNTTTGAVVYKPTAGYHGTDGFTFTVTDADGTSSPATVTLNVAIGTPTATAQTDPVAHDSAGTLITLAGTDDDTPALTQTFAFTQPAHGTVTVSGATGSPTVTYTPTAGYHGADSFTFTDSNGTNISPPATVTLNVAIGTPTANAQTFAIPHDSPGTPITLSDTDDDSPALTQTFFVATQPAHGSLSGTAPNLTYTPTPGYHGVDSFTFTAKNGTNTSAPATVTLNVAIGTPTATAQTDPVAHDSAGTLITLAGTDDDTPALTQTFAFTQPAHGTVTVSGATGSPTVTYTPTAGYHGADSFTFTDSNGTNISPPATVTLNVAIGTPTANAQTVNTNQNTALNITLTGTDDDSPALAQAFAFTQPAHGMVTVSGSPGSPTVVYTPTAGYTGPDSFTFTDGNGTNTSAPATVTINVASTVATVSNTVGVTWGSAGTATLQTNADGLRLLPSGRGIDLPWLGLKTLAITLSQSEALSPSDVTVTGVSFGSYGPVTISGSGTSYVITLGQAIVASDRVTVTIGNAGISTFTRRLDVLPGDFNDDGVVNASDMTLINNATVLSYNVFADIDGDGHVTVADVQLARKRIGTRLP